MLVMKFGGTSVGSAERILQMIEIVKGAAARESVVVVVSAMSGITNLLEEACKKAAVQDENFRTVVEAISRRHDECIGALGLSPQISSRLIVHIREPLVRLGEICKGLFLVGDLTPKTKAHIMGYGELLSSRIVNAAMEEAGIQPTWIDSRQVIITNHDYESAQVDLNRTYHRIQEIVDREKGVHIVPGYIARSETGENTTLGRGGSDYTASLFAAALEAHRLEIWTDVNGMLSADPRLVSDTITIPKMSYEEAMELSYFGAKVIYPPTIQPAMARHIPIVIKNSFEPSHEGTIISEETQPDQYFVKGLTSIQHVSLFTVTGPGMIGVSGLADQLFHALREEKVSVLFITQSSSEHTICFAVHKADSPRVQMALEATWPVDSRDSRLTLVHVEENMGLIAVVGDGMRERSGIAGKIFSLLGENGINIRAIAQGSTERNVSFIINQFHVAKALNVLHEGFFLSSHKTIHLFILGAGNVGATLLNQIREAQVHFLKAGSLQIKVSGIANSKMMLLDQEGIDLRHWETRLKSEGQAIDLKVLLDRIRTFNLRNSILIDVTASEEVSNLYPALLASNVHIVTANKIAASSPYPHYAELKHLSAKHNVRFLNETNVGAGLPVIKTIRDLVLTGDHIHRIQAVLSGSLNYVFDRIGSEGILFSQAVREAREKGYTEPNPSLDLSGKDVMRKILILAREAGLKLEMDDIQNKPFLPAETLQAEDWDGLYENLKAMDPQMESERLRLSSEKKRWRYMASLIDGKVSTGLEEIDETHPAYHLKDTDNIILIWTDRYQKRPMVIAGAGAGPEVTASGVLADVISIANV